VLTVLTWLWAQPGGRTTYTARHVNVWRDMVQRHLSIDHEVACVTDMPQGIDPGIRIIHPPRQLEDVRIPTWGPRRPQCFRRLAMFRRDAADLFGAERIVCMDLDVAIGGSLDKLLGGGEDFRIAAGTSPGRLYNGSMMMIRAGSRPKVYEEFTPAKAVLAGKKFVGSDQAWLSYILGRGEKVWRVDDGLVHWMARHQAPAPRMMSFPGPTKPWQLVELGTVPWVCRHYRRNPTGRCLVLGYGPAVWSDLEAALDCGEHFDEVILSPETRPYWPGPVLAVADDDRHAERIAAMHGLHPVWCGRSEGVQINAAA
jgi:hypothetical protein